jgi:AcrR family transcriptional regulator
VARRANPALAVDIVRVATDLIEEKGPDNITMREVAERLGYSATTIYLYYKDKEELLDAAIERAFEWFANYQDDLASKVSGTDILRVRSRGYVQWGIEHPMMYRAMFERPQKNWAQASAGRRRSYFAYRDAMQALMDEGVLRKTENVIDVVNLSWATNHGLVSLMITGRMFGPIGETISPRDAEARVHAMVNEAFDQWLCAWSVEGCAPEGSADGCGCDAG